MAASLTSVKVKHGKTTRRFTANNIETLFPDLNSLRHKIFSLLFLHIETDFTLKYIDEDGDEVSLSDGEDLRELFRQNLNHLTILVDSKPDLPHLMRTRSCSDRRLSMDDEAFAYFRWLRLKAVVDHALKLSNALALLIDSLTVELRYGGVFAENGAPETTVLKEFGDRDHDGSDYNNFDLNVYQEFGDDVQIGDRDHDGNDYINFDLNLCHDHEAVLIDALKETSDFVRHGDHDNDGNDNNFNVDLNVCHDLGDFLLTEDMKKDDGQESQSNMIEDGDDLGILEYHSDYISQGLTNVAHNSESFAVIKTDSNEADLGDNASLKIREAINSESEEALKVKQYVPELYFEGYTANDTSDNGFLHYVPYNANDRTSSMTKFGRKISLPTKDMYVSDSENESRDDINDSLNEDDSDPVEPSDNELNILSDLDVDDDDEGVNTNESESADIVETIVETNDDVGDGDFLEKCDFSDEETALTKLSEMGFAENEFTKEVLKVHRYKIEDSMDDLCGDSEWDLMIEELQEMPMEATRKWW